MLQDTEKHQEELISVVKIFNKYVSSLLKILEINEVKKKKTELMVLRKELDNNKKLVPNKNWFYEKIEELS